jgi:2-desacetyl-2-hydroxyethyl bacteriochlorophyllide A dehydrogenase
MKAAYYNGNKEFKLTTGTEVAPGQGEVKIKVAYCGICGTDQHIFHGVMDKRVSIPQVIGHEASGVVVEIGSGVDNVKVGDKVVVRPLNWCGECPTCEAGNSHICTSLKFMGIDSIGAFQEYWTVKARILHKCPDNISLKTAALIEPLAVACHDLRRGRLKAGEYAVILGGGPIGLLIAMAAREAGAKVIISEINEYRLKLAADMGFGTFNPLHGDLKAHVMTATANTGADVVFEVTASAPGAAIMTELLRPRGRIVLVGIYSQPQTINLFNFFWKELEMIGARVYEPEDFDQAVKLTAEGKLPLEDIISGVYNLTEIQQAFESFEGNSTAMKVLVQCEQN